MERADLIRMITEEVLRAVSPAAAPAVPAAPVPVAAAVAAPPFVAPVAQVAQVQAGPRLLVILTGGLDGHAAVLPALAAIAALPMQAQVLLSPGAEEQARNGGLLERLPLPVLPRQEVHGRRAQTVRAFDLFCVPALTINALAKATAGIRDGLINDLLGWILLSGKPLVVARDNIGASVGDLAALGVTDMTPAYKRLIGRHLQELQGLGAAVVALAALPDALRKAAPARQQTAPARRGEASARRSVVTADELERFQGAEYVLPPGAILTPLARDVASRRKIALRTAE